MVRKPSKTAHLLIRRNFSGKMFKRYHSYKKKGDAVAAAKRLRKEGKRARVFVSKGEKYEYTVYTRGKK